MDKVVIARVGGEIGIKSKFVRSMYERKLMKVIRSSLQREDIPFSEITRTAGRIYIFTEDSEETARRVSKIFGISSTSVALATSSELEEILKAGSELAVSHFKPGTFAVKCRRSGSHQYTSMDVASLLGASILNLRKDLKVNLKSPDQSLYVEIKGGRAYLYLESIKGADGFPLGTQDLLLGIIDDTKESVIASWCVMKRGAVLKVITFEVNGVMPEETRTNLRKLVEWIPERVLEMIIVPLPTGDEKLLRSYELLIAISLAKKEGILGVVSGIRPTKISKLGVIPTTGVQVFLPLIALEEETLDEWSRAIDLGSCRADKGDLEVERITDKEFEDALSKSRRIKISPKLNFF
ncbi:MAG: THUMP domain-containing protein [Candidatus Methanomethylicaceae archaeon]